MVGGELQALSMVAVGERLQRPALLLLQRLPGGLLLGQRLAAGGLARLARLGMALLALAARLQGVVHLLGGATPGAARLVETGVRLLNLLVPTPQGLLGGPLLLAGRLQRRLGGGDLGQQVRLLAGMVGRGDGGEIQRQAVEVVAGGIVELRGQVTPRQQLGGDHLAQPLLPARAMVAQEVAQAALGGVALGLERLAARLGAAALGADGLQLALGGLALLLASVEFTAQLLQGGRGGTLLALGLVDPGLGLLGLADLLGALGMMLEPCPELGEPRGHRLQPRAVVVVERLAPSLVVGLQAVLGLALRLAARLPLLAQGVDLRLELVAARLEQVTELHQSRLQPGLALLHYLLQLLQVVAQLLLLLAPLGQCLQVLLQGRHVGRLEGLIAMLQVVEVGAGLGQLAVEAAGTLVEGVALLLVGRLQGLDIALAALDLGLAVGLLTLGAVTVGGELGPQLPQRGLELADLAIQALELGKRALQRRQAHGLAHTGDPLPRLGVADAGHRQLDTILLEDRRQHGLEGVHLALLGVHRRDQLLHVADALTGAHQAEAGRHLAQAQRLLAAAPGLGAALGEVVLDHRAVLGGGPQLGGDRHAPPAQAVGPLGVVQGHHPGLALHQVVLGAVGVADEAVLDPALAAPGQHRLADVTLLAAILVDQVAVAMRQVEGVELEAGARHHPVGQLAIEDRHQALQGGLARGVGTADVGVALHTQLDHALEVAVDHHDA